MPIRMSHAHAARSCLRPLGWYALGGTSASDAPCLARLLSRDSPSIDRRTFRKGRFVEQKTASIRLPIRRHAANGLSRQEVPGLTGSRAAMECGHMRGMPNGQAGSDSGGVPVSSPRVRPSRSVDRDTSMCWSAVWNSRKRGRCHSCPGFVATTGSRQIGKQLTTSH